MNGAKKIMKGFVVTMGIVLLTASAGSAKNIHVPGDSSTIQAGINGAEAGDTVLVADGLYIGAGNRNIDFLGKAIVVRSENGPEVTVIDCEKDGRGFFFHNNEDSDSKLEGFTITNGFAGEGAGVCCWNASPTISNCSINGNEAYAPEWGEANGGGISCEVAIISNCIISDNIADVSGWHGNAWGGGISCNSAIITNCIITRNDASGGLMGMSGAGGIDCFGGANIANCIILENEHGGILCSFFESTYISNCIVWSNSDFEIYANGFSDTTITYSNIKGGWPGEGNIDEDPLFRDPNNGDYHLMATYCGDPYDSPCIDAGDPSFFDEVLDCWHGLGASRSDMGAYGGSNASWPTAVEEDEGEAPYIPKEFALHQNYPNPFNSETVLIYSLPQSGRARLSVYNVLGQRVATLFEGIQEASLHNVVWDAVDFSSGIYFARLEAGGHSKTIKMILLK